MKTTWDFGDGSGLQDITLTAEDMDYPKAVRKYYSATVEVERVFDGKWTAQFSYTWSHNYGNTEGLVLSDNGQTDAGITQLFDTPTLVRNTYGNLPNDRRHYFKAYGSYAVTRQVMVGLNLSLSSGKPINMIGYYDDPSADFYGAAYLLVPRGTAGSTEWVFSGDLSLVYRPSWGKDKLAFQVDVFNLFGRDGVVAVDEFATSDENEPNPSYLRPTDFQTPRYVQFGVKLDF